MIFMFLIAAVVGITALAVGVLPCGTVNIALGCTSDKAFMPLPTAISTSLSNVLGWIKWLIYLPGDGFGNAAVGGMLTLLSIAVIMLIWRALRNIDIPILNRFI